VYRPKSTRHGQWKAHSDCHAITEESFLILPLYSYVYSRLSPSPPPSPYISFLFGSLAGPESCQLVRLFGQSCQISATSAFEYSLSRQHWFIGLRDTIYLFLLLLLQQLPPSYLDSSQQRHQLPCVIYSVVVRVASNMH
jgi:hypothetical protein